MCISEVIDISPGNLDSHSRMSDSQWVITPLWLSGSWRSFLYSSSVYSCHLFLISSASLRSLPFLSFIEPIFAWNVPLVSVIFLKRSLVFPILLFSSISLHRMLPLVLTVHPPLVRWLERWYTNQPQVNIVQWCLSPEVDLDYFSSLTWGQVEDRWNL